MSVNNKELKDFIENWVDDLPKMKIAFLELVVYLQELEEVYLGFLSRPGLTYSLRGVSRKQKDEPLFAMVDVIEGEPRWLSVCFYSKMISDPEGIGDFVPAGLLGEDGICFDLEEYSEGKIAYLKARIGEAYDNSCQNESVI